MAERRMFAKTIVLSDAFLNMPMSARCLYFTLGMLADDDGFVNAPRSVMRQCGASEDDMKLLILKKFVIEFDTGVIVIKHWRINNYLRNDRYTETKYIDEKDCLSIDDSGNYHIKSGVGIPVGIPGGIPSIGKDSIDKNSIDNIYIAQNPPEKSPIEKMFEQFWEAYGNKKGKKNAKRAFSKINPNEELFKQIMDGIEKYHQSRQWKDNYRKEPATWLNGECWNDDYTNEMGGVNGRTELGGIYQEKAGGNTNGPRTTYTLKPRFAGHKYDADGNDITDG